MSVNLLSLVLHTVMSGEYFIFHENICLKFVFFSSSSVDETFSCRSDVQCPFNFNCDIRRQECLVAECKLTDDIDSVYNEGSTCVFDEDCLFFVPRDVNYTHTWGCICNTKQSIQRDAERINNRNRVIRSVTETDCLSRQCKRCPSHPRVIFNATSEFNDLVEVFVENSIDLTSSTLNISIPPLALLLNSSDFAIEPPPTEYYWRRDTIIPNSVYDNSSDTLSTSFNSSTTHSTTTINATEIEHELTRSIADEDATTNINLNSPLVTPVYNNTDDDDNNTTTRDEIVSNRTVIRDEIILLDKNNSLTSVDDKNNTVTPVGIIIDNINSTVTRDEVMEENMNSTVTRDAEITTDETVITGNNTVLMSESTR